MVLIEWMRFWTLQFLFWASGAVFTYPLERRKRFKVRAACFAVIILIYSWIFRFILWDGQVSTEYFCRFFSMVLMFCFIYNGWKITFSTAVYNSIWAIVLWQILTEVWAMIEFLGETYFAEHQFMIIVGMVLLFVVSHIIVAKTIGKWMPIDRKESIGTRQLSSALLIFAIIEVLSMSQALRHVEAYSTEWKFLYISQMLCIVILYLQNELFKKSAMRQELALMNLLWKNKQEQYEVSKENINLLNQKSHDMKHQIQALRKMKKEDFDKYLDELEDTVGIYEAIVKTGNDVFDTILTEKSLYCREKQIQVNCVADGSQLDFIETIDLYAILGNAIDNAIEAVKQFEETEKRQIDIQIYRQQSFLVMHFINPIPGEILYEDELPITTKGNKDYHGFGLRSIRHFVKKYEGVMKINEEDGCFSLKIMIPIP